MADRTDLKQMLDLLLKEVVLIFFHTCTLLRYFCVQERLQSLSMDSLRNENAHLQEEVMRLQREKEEWRVSLCTILLFDCWFKLYYRN